MVIITKTKPDLHNNVYFLKCIKFSYETVTVERFTQISFGFGYNEQQMECEFEQTVNTEKIGKIVV